MTVENDQDTQNNESSGFGLNISSTGSNSISANSSSSDKTFVNQQSGIHTKNGASGTIGGDVNLNGAYLVNIV